MVTPLTPQYIAEIKAVVEENHKTDFYISNGGVAGLIATLEARNAAFDAMLEALKYTKEGMEDGYECDAYFAVCSSITQAEKVS